MDNLLVTNLKNFRVLLCIRDQFSTTVWENGRPVKYPEVAVSFQPLRNEQTKEPETILADSPEAALDVAQRMLFPGSPLRHSLAVEPC